MSAFAEATIGTERLLLTPLCPQDADEMVEVLADPRRHQFIGGRPATLQELRTRYATLTAGRGASRARGSGDAKLRASRLLAESYQLAAILMLKLGESNAAWVAADRGILAAERAEDPLVVASGARILAYAFLGAGHFAKAKELTISAAGVLEPGLGNASPAYLSLYGALLLKGAMAAAYQGDPITSRGLLNEAASTAARLGTDANHAFTAFGPTNVGVHRVSAAVALGDGGAALQHAKAVHPVQLPVVERRAQNLVDVAHGHGQAGGDDQALRALLTAEHLAPRRSATSRPPGCWWPSCCIGSGPGASRSSGRWLSGSAPSPDATRTGRAP